MSRIDELFRSLERPAFIAYIVAGYPDVATSLSASRALIDGGADILEIGIPFSDPLADGPTIQRAHESALVGGMTQDRVFELVKEIRNNYTTPVVLLAYANHLVARGISRFYEDAAAAGVDGVLVVDMPPEECEEARLNAEKNEIDQIFIIAPTTRGHRRDMILQKSAGFLYLVSVLGVTGVRHTLSPETLAFVRDLRSHTAVPLAVGFGISSPGHVMPLAVAGADAVIVGSGIVDIIGRSIAGQRSTHDELAAFARDMREACNHCRNVNRQRIEIP